MPRDIFDSIVVGGGPAGLSAAIYLGRFLRKTVVIDGGSGRSTGRQVNENYFGFPRGVRASRLRELGTAQAERFGVRFVAGTIASAALKNDLFVVEGDCGKWRGRTLIVASGVTDVWPTFPRVERHIGKSLFWCITCDGFRTRGRRLVLVGADDEAAITARQFLAFTRDILFIEEKVGDDNAISSRQAAAMRKQGIQIVEGRIERVIGRAGNLTAVEVEGQRYDADLIFSLLGSVPNSQLAAQLGALLDSSGFINITNEQRTNVPGLYAAGDVTGPYAHQVSSAVHEGAMAGQAANFDLYAANQKA
ncbi:MAG TPA: NAD(P)/FAD-dependent oxidoreductase [Dehalococcoidia bacterium]|nr:NAD(P)/FAD-dependent oxidoreductase [Dehalococcoidia bacterium]